MMNIRDVLVRRRQMKAKTQQVKAEIARKSKIHYVPIIALVAANLLVVSLDYRVVEAVYKLTDNVALSVFALFTSGAMFILWFDVLYQYLLKNDNQNKISLAFSGLSLVSAGMFAFLDYGLSAGYGVDQVLPVEANLLFAAMVILTVANGIGLFAWYILDDQVQRKTTVERNRADNDFESETLEDANRMLEKAGKVLENKSVMEKRYGKEAVEEMLSMLAGIETALGIDLDGDGSIGKPQQTRPAFAQETDAPKLPNQSAGEGKP
jgi:hypothetical protein